MALTPSTAFVAEFCFKHLRFSWKEKYVFQSEGSDLQTVLQAARELAPLRVVMLGSDKSIVGSPYLDRVQVSQGSVFRDVLMTSEFQTSTPQLAWDQTGTGAASSFLAMEWKAVSGDSYWAVRYMAGIPWAIFSAPDPANHPKMLDSFNNFKKDLIRNWGFVAIDRQNIPSRDVPIWHMKRVDDTHVDIYTGTLPNLDDYVNIVNGRFLRDTPRIRGDYRVISLGANFFTILADTTGEPLSYVSSAVWRKPVSIVVPFTDATQMIGITHHKRGFTLHAEQGRKRPARNPRF